MILSNSVRFGFILRTQFGQATSTEYWQSSHGDGTDGECVRLVSSKILKGIHQQEARYGGQV